MKKAFFFDIDGTLLSLEQDTILPETKYAISELKKAGHEVFIATGKSIQHAKWVGDDLGVASFIATNGQVVQVDGKLLYENGFTHEEVQDWIKLAEEHDLVIGFQGTYESSIYGDNEKNMASAAEFFKSVNIPMPTKVDHFEETFKVGQMWVVGDYSNLEYDQEKFKIVKWPFAGADVLPVGVSKEVGIKHYIESLDEEVQTYAFGDGHNDVEMFGAVDVAVAMGNADDYVKSFATDITDTCEEFGIYNYLVKHDLIKEKDE